MANITTDSMQLADTGTAMSNLFSKIETIHLLQNPLLNSLLLALMIMIASFVAAWIIYFILEKIIYRLTKYTETKIDDLIVEHSKKPFYFIVLFIGLRIALYPLPITPFIEGILVGVIHSLIIITIFYIISKSINIIIDEWGKDFAKRTHSSLDDQLLSLFHKIINITIIIIAAVVILNQWGVKVTPILASLGIAGLALGLALQNTLGNVFGGIQLILDHCMEVGDTVKIGNDVGTVEGVGIRSTRIRTADNELLILPNGPLSSMIIQNSAHPDPSLRIVVDFGVEYGTDPKKVKKIVEETLNDIKKVIKKPAPSVVLFEMGDFALKFKAIFWIASFQDKFDLKVEATTNIYDALTKNNIGIPYPTQTLHIKKEE